MNILSRADSSSQIGTGHIMRDLVLAKQFENDTITFATRNLDGNINFRINESNYFLEILESNDIDELDNLIKKLKIDMIIIDNYDIDYTFEKQLSTLNPKLSIMVLDDTYEKHHCDILLNHNISANKKRYKNSVPKNCKLKCGAKYTLLRDEFYTEKKKKQFSILNSQFSIFLAMGGADHSDINIKILKVLKKFDNIKVNLVTTSANKNLKKLEKYCKNKPWIKLHINSNKIAKLMSKSDLAIVTPSVTVNEVYYLGVPMIAIKTANNQIDMYEYLKKKKYLVLEEFSSDKLNKSISKMLKLKR
mgnify:CR=1 FL=1